MAVHLSSKLYQKDHDQVLTCTRIARIIEAAEEKVGHRRTVLLGDLNMNPFEHGVVGAEGLHAVMSRTVARKSSRIVDSEERHFFYNPMWSQFGDHPSGPPGTYYYTGGKQVEYFWYMFDQVMLRPELLSRFNDADLKLVTSAGATSLLSAAERIDNKAASDHLPIAFSLDL